MKTNLSDISKLMDWFFCISLIKTSSISSFFKILSFKWSYSGHYKIMTGNEYLKLNEKRRRWSEENDRTWIIQFRNSIQDILTNEEW